MIAAVVDPVRRKAYWSEKISEGGGVWKAGYRKSRTTARSISLLSLVSIGVGLTDIGRKSEPECSAGTPTFGTGLMRASFHCCGTVDV